MHWLAMHAFVCDSTNIFVSHGHGQTSIDQAVHRNCHAKMNLKSETPTSPSWQRSAQLITAPGLRYALHFIYSLAVWFT